MRKRSTPVLLIPPMRLDHAWIGEREPAVEEASGKDAIAAPLPATGGWDE